MVKHNWGKIIGAMLLIAIVAFFWFKPQQEITFSKEEYEQFKESATAEEYFSVINKNMQSGGPPKDGIPSIDNPKYVSASEADKTLTPTDKVFGINYNGDIKAFPQSIMYWHEIVNEEIAGEKVSITYCPLTGSVIGFTGKELGVSGKLYNSNLVMYDRASDSDIPQMLQTAVNGPTVGEALTNVHVYVTTWEQWKKKYPTTLVLSSDTGANRDYSRNPYPGYEDVLRVWFPVAASSKELPTKEWVTGAILDGQPYAFHKKALKEKSSVDVKVNNKEFMAIYADELDTIQVIEINEHDEVVVPSFDAYWFAWYAYHPDTELWK